MNQTVVQFGITNVPKRRLATHRRSGFTSDPVALIPFESGYEAAALERAIKKIQKIHQVPTALKEGLVFSGCSEAFVWSTNAVPLAEEIVKLIGIEMNVLRAVIHKSNLQGKGVA